MKEEKFPHTMKPLHWQRQAVQGGGGSEASEPQRRAQQQHCRGQSRENPAKGIGADRTYQLERLVCSPAGAGGVWELKLGLWSSDPRDKTWVGCMNRARRGLVHHS